VRKEEIDGVATRPLILLQATSSLPPPEGRTIDFGRVETLWSTEAAHAVAAAGLEAAARRELAAEVQSEGAAIQPGKPASIEVGESRFNGKYYVTGVSHRYEGGRTWITLVSLGGGRDRGFFALPEVGDEVLVGFEHGDPERPIVLGSLWNVPARADESPCGR
jgi:hypothetical protein